MAKDKSTPARGKWMRANEYGNEVIRVNLKLPKKVHTRLLAHVHGRDVTVQRFLYELLLAKLDAK